MLVFDNDTTDAANIVNDRLTSRAHLAIYAYLINRPPINSGGTMWLFSGLLDTNRRLSSVQTCQQLNELFLPYFVERAPFRHRLQEFHTNAWVQRWCADFASLLEEANRGSWLICPPFEMSMLSLWDASINCRVDFRIPALVRAIEALIALPPGPGKPLFAERAALFAQDVAAHPYFLASGMTLNLLLRNLFQLRSDAVHGKWPLRDMQDAGRADEVALFDYAAEMIARAIIRWALRNRATFATYRTRAALEAAWADNTIPPP